MDRHVLSRYRVLVMSAGRIVHEASAAGADKRVIGKYMAGMKAA
jgi:simple sugar transport system ATP-binding protein